MRICVETVQRLTEISGVAGAHLMALVDFGPADKPRDALRIRCALNTLPADKLIINPPLWAEKNPVACPGTERRARSVIP